MQKKWKHDKDGGEVSRITGICNKCNKHPKGSEITLVNNKKKSVGSSSMSQRNMRYESLLGISRSLLFRYPRQ